MSLPKIIHSVRMGHQPVSELNRRCEDSWHKICPDWKFMHWTDEDLPKDDWCNRALKKQPANASIYMRLHALYLYGGVYCDNDAELIRPPDLQHPCFFGFQRDDVDVECVNDGCMGAEAGHPFLELRMRAIRSQAPDIPPSSLGPRLLTEELRQLGLKGTNIEQDIGLGIHVYAKEVLYPFRWDQRPERSYLTDRTISIHWFEGSWLAQKFPQATGKFDDQ